jgi:hypothetical protein
VVIKKFSEKHALDASARPIVLANDPGRSMQLRQFFKMAEHRKRQMLEKMLMD